MNDNVIEFITYKNALKGNYRKGVHTMRCILENPAQAADFAASVGAVSVVFGVPVDKPDRNSDELLELVLNSSVCDKATLTFLSQFYPENAESYDTMMNSAERCAEIFATPILWRPVGRSNCLTAKLIVTMAGLNCVDYGDLAAVVSSSVAMTAVAASQTAMEAVAASQTAMAAVIANSTALNAVVSSSTAMAAVAASATARAAIYASDVAFNTFLNLATYDTISGTYSGSGWSTRYNGPCIVLQWCYSYSSGTSGIRTCLDGTASRQYTSSQRYNSSMGSSNINDHNKKSGTYYKEFVFCSKLETYNSQSDWPAISIAYFKLP